jgi:pimeloyl-ACP methyl ester carboxylesterase
MPARPRITSGTVEADGLVFDVLRCGPRAGEPVLLLHGFPQTADCWRGLMPLLAARGYRCIAPTQRGYSPGARPRGVGGYATDRLVQDALDVAAAESDTPVHVVGHDLGGMLAWLLAARHGDALRTACVLSTPHPAAYASALLRSPQALQSAYIAVFRLPWLPELLLRPGLQPFLRAGGLDEDTAARYASALSPSGGLTAALNWYRAASLGLARTPPARVPTLYVWGERDPALGRTAAEATRGHVTAPYRFVPLADAGHWLPEMHAGQVAAALLQHLGRFRG